MALYGSARAVCMCLYLCRCVYILEYVCTRVSVHLCACRCMCVCLHVLMSFDNLYESARAHVGIPAHVSPHDRIARQRQEGRMALE